MTPEQKAAFIMAQAAALNATVAGMIARNQLNALNGEPPTYLEVDFDNQVASFDCHHNQICMYFNEPGVPN